MSPLVQEKKNARVEAANWKRRRFTPEQAREIRLSTLANADEARARGVSLETIRDIRSGARYGALLPDERAAEDARTREFDPREEGTFQAFHALTIGSKFPVQGRPDLADRFDRIDALDAAHECRHGRLPSDRTPACGCFPHEEGFGVVEGERVSEPNATEEAAA